MVANNLRSREPDHLYPFWDKRNDWPRDPPGFVFLARACHEVGRTIYGARWIESYSFIDDLEEQIEPPDDCDDETWDKYERSCDEAILSFRAMRAEVVKALVEASEAGNLITAVRPIRGGKLTNLDTHFWFTEHGEARFEHCDISPGDPFRTKRPLYDPCWIFVERNTLAQILTRLPPKAELSGRVEASTNSLPDIKPYSQPRNHRMLLAKKALLYLHGENGPPFGVTEERCFQDVNKWVRDNGEPKGVSKPTIRRAKRDLRRGTSLPERS